MTTPYWDRTLLGAGGGRKTAEVQRSRSSVGASSSSTPASPSRRSSGYSPKPYKKRSQRVLLHDLSDPTSLPSQLAAAQQAAAAAGHDVPPSYTSHYFSLPPSDYMMTKKNRFTTQQEQEKCGGLHNERARGSEILGQSAEPGVCVEDTGLEDVPVQDVPLYTEAYKHSPNTNDDIGNRFNSRSSVRTRRTAFAQKPIQQNLLSTSGESPDLENKDYVDNAHTTTEEAIQHPSNPNEKNNNTSDGYGGYYQHYPHHYYRRPQNISSLRQSRSLSTSPPPSQASSSASRYTAAAATRIGERGATNIGIPQQQHSPLHISASSGKTAHPRRTPLSATLSDSMHFAFGHRDPQMYNINNSGINYLPQSPSLQRAAQYKSDDESAYKANQYLPMQLSQQQAEARNLVLNEIKELQLRRQSSFKRVMRLPPIWRTAHAAATFQSSPSSSPRRRGVDMDSSNLSSHSTFKGEPSNMGSSSAGSGGGTPDRISRNQLGGATPEQGTSSPGHSEVDGQIQGSGMFSDSLMNSVLPGGSSKIMPGVSDRWQQHQSRHQGGGVAGERAPSSGSTSLKYSQSLKDPTKDPKRGANHQRERRKHSDPALGNNIPRISGEEAATEGPSQHITNHQSGSSSNSSLSTRSSLDSPHLSSNNVTGISGMPAPGAPSPSITSKNTETTSIASSSTTGHNEPMGYIQSQSYQSSAGSGPREIEGDSDFEAERDPPDWRPKMSQDELARLKPKEKKRQDVINELFHTERTHVRKLKVLNHFFYRPLQKNELMPKELFNRLFANLPEVLALHVEYNQIMKDRVKSSGFPIGNISDILNDMFDGKNGDRLIKVGSEFTKNQKYTIEELKQQRSRDHKLDNFLNQQESLKECRRLQLQAMLPAEHQRLVKYPLMLEQLAKQCEKIKPSSKSRKNPDEDSSKPQENDKGEASGDDEPAGRGSKASTASSVADAPKSPSTEDRDNLAFVESSLIKQFVERTRDIVDTIDKQVAEAQNIQRLAEIQQNLDLSGLEKFPDNPISIEYRNLNLTEHRLIYDGILTMKIGDTRKIRTIELHVVLLEDCIMLLQKQDDKYVLKFHTSTAGPGIGAASSGKFNHSPVIKFSTLLVRPVATDKRAFYLLNTTQNGPQIYELVANSTADRSQWFRHITEASNAYKQRGYRQGGDSASARPQNGLDDLHGRGGKHEGEQSLGVPGSGLFDGDKKGQPMGRSQSFNEQTTSSREPHSRERGPSSPPEDIPSEPDTFATKTGDSTDSGTTSGGGNTGQGKKKTYQRVEILKIAEPCPLIDPSQVVVTQGEILRADPVLTPIEKLRRKDAEVAKALEEKERLIADILHIPPPLSSTSLDVYGRASSSGDIENPFDDPSGALDIQHQMSDKDATKVLLAALEQAKNLSDLVNESLTLSEEATVAASADVSRLSSPPPSTAPQIMHSISSNVEDGSSPISSTGATGELVQGTNTGDNSMTSSELQVREFKGANFGLSNSRKILPGPPPERLVAITNNMNSHLTSLLAIFKEREEERERLRRELQRSQEQVHALLSQSAASHRASSGNLSAAATISESTATAATPSQESRPVSYISVEESSGPEMSEKNHESEDDASATITTTTTITLTTLDPENNNDSVSIPIKTTTTSTKSSVTDRDNNNKIQCDNKNKGENDTHPQNSQNVSKLTNKASRSTSASTEERNQSTDEQDISFSRLSMEDRDCSNTDASQASTASKIKHQPSTEKGEQEANDNDKPEDISKQDTETAEITVVLETTSTTSEV